MKVIKVIKKTSTTKGFLWNFTSRIEIQNVSKVSGARSGCLNLLIHLFVYSLSV